MHSSYSRRTFVSALAATSALTALPSFAASSSNIRFGCSAITWNEHDRQAIDDIAAAGYNGIQLRGNAVTEFQISELKDLLAQHKLTFVALSSGQIDIDKADESEIAKHVANAKFLKAGGGHYLQILDQLKPSPRTATTEDCKKLGKLLTEIGKRTADIGVPLTYHNHMGSITEQPGKLDIVLENSDPKYIHLELDVAHAAEGGSDPVEIINRWHDRLLFLHLKDVVDTPGAQQPYKWVELGQGKVNLPGVFTALKKHNFSGWAIVELDRVPDPNKTPKQCAITSRNYLSKILGF